MAELAVERVIDSAHGRKIHGHSFKVNVTFAGTVENDMVSGIDFHDAIDKKYLNDIEGMGRATVENIAVYIIRHLKGIEGLYAVTVWEGLDRYAKIFANEVD